MFPVERTSSCRLEPTTGGFCNGKKSTSCAGGQKALAMDRIKTPRYIRAKVCQPNPKYRGGLVMKDINSLEQSLPLRVYKVEMSIPHRICTKVSQTGNLSRNKSRYRINTQKAMRTKGSGNNRSKCMPGSYPYAHQYTAEK